MRLTKSPKSETFRVARFHPALKPILREFPEDVCREVGKAIFDLQRGGLLTMPLSRPMPVVGRGAHELRVKDRSGAYRVFYMLGANDGVYVFHAFKKTTTATPAREIELGKKRLWEMR